ncbi:MAG TPA: hypothetical protein VJP85_11040 [Candidatus Baltobacteraceae bacterium]|nr:hypothetical protein [Candidatus Baltobacteraceae bacterium]
MQNYYDANGSPIGTSMANGMGGSDYYSRSGKYLGQTNHSGTFDAQAKPITSGQKLGDLLLGHDDD